MAIEARIVPTPAIPTLGQDAGYGWQLFQGVYCVGTSEKSCTTVERAQSAAERYAAKYGYGRIDAVRLVAKRWGD